MKNYTIEDLIKKGKAHVVIDYGYYKIVEYKDSYYLVDEEYEEPDELELVKTVHSVKLNDIISWYDENNCIFSDDDEEELDFIFSGYTDEEDTIYQYFR